MCPASLAKSIGNRPNADRGKCGAPMSSNCLTASKFPCCAASCNGTQPVPLFLACTLALASTNNLTMAADFPRHAYYN